MSSRSKKGKARPGTVVIDVISLKKDWMAKEPNGKKREAACVAEGTKWKIFSAWCAPSNNIDGHANLSIDNYFKFIRASGLDPDKYEVKGANPDDFIVYRHHLPKSKKSATSDGKSTPESSNPSTSSVNSIADQLPNYPEPACKEPEIVIFEKPGKKSTQNSNKTASYVIDKFKPVNISNSSGSTYPNKQNKSNTLTPANTAPSRPTTGYVRTIKHDEVPNRKKGFNSPAFVRFSQKMKSFSTHLSVYLCSLHLNADNVIFSTSITDFRDIRDGRKELQFYDYIILSDYLLKAYKACEDVDAQKMFDQLATLFDDIYISTLYYKNMEYATS